MRRSGVGYAWHSHRSSVPSRIDGCTDIQVAAIALGHEATLLLSEDGEVLATGFNSDGQLATPRDQLTASSIPIPIQLALPSAPAQPRPRLLRSGQEKAEIPKM